MPLFPSISIITTELYVKIEIGVQNSGLTLKMNITFYNGELFWNSKMLLIPFIMIGTICVVHISPYNCTEKIKVPLNFRNSTFLA